MRIVFGHNHYCRKKVQLEELGILTPLENIKHFELTQRYAHLYWLPIFPIGYSWSARAKDGKLYKISETLEQQLKHIQYSWTSGLIAFLGPILLFLGLGGYLLSQKYKDYKRHQEWVADKNMEYEQKVKVINNPSTEDYYNFSGVEDVYAKVVGFNDTALLLSGAEVPHNAKPAEVIAFLDDTTRHITPQWVSKNTLRKMLDKVHPFDTTLFGSASLNLYETKRLREPIMVYRFNHSSGNSSIGFSLQNDGIDLEITDIDKMKSTISWSDSLPYAYKYGESIRFEMDFPNHNANWDIPTEFSFGITCIDEKGKTYKYKVDGKSSPNDKVELTRVL